MTEIKQQAIPKHVPKPGDTIAGVIVLEVIHHNTPTGKASPRLSVRCKCGEAFKCTYSWARQVEMGTDKRSKNTTVSCPECMRQKQSKTMKANVETHHEQQRLRVALSPEEEARVDEIIRDHANACRRNGFRPENIERARLEAIEIVLIERRTNENQLPRWTPETIRQGLGERRFRQYETPAVGLL